MIYRTLKKLISKGRTDGLEEKIDVFYAVGKLTEAEYTELLDLLEKAA